jgi:hypothetical protein
MKMKLLKLARKGCGLMLVMAAIASPAYAYIVPVPEIDPGSMGSAFALLSCGMIMITDRLWRK